MNHMIMTIVPTGRVTLWIRKNLFSSWLNGLITIALGWLIYNVASAAIEWGVINAVWPGSDVEGCWDNPETPSGACWALIYKYRNVFTVYGYPPDEEWRVYMVSGAINASMIWLSWKSAPYKIWVGLFLLVILPVLSYVLLEHGLLATGKTLFDLGGLLGSLYFAYLGFVVALFMGLLFCLLRRTDMAVIRWVARMFSSGLSFTPVVIVALMFSTFINYFLPTGYAWDISSRTIILLGVLLSPYVGGCFVSAMGAVPKQQDLLARSLGLGYWQSMALVIFPQALRIAVPGLMNNLTGLIKATSLLIIIGYQGFYGIGTAVFTGLRNQSLDSDSAVLTVMVFMTVTYCVVCVGLKTYGRQLQRVMRTPGQSSTPIEKGIEHRGDDGASIA